MRRVIDLGQGVFPGEVGRFLGSVSERLGMLEKDFRLDSNLSGLVALDGFSTEDGKIVSTLNVLKDGL